MRMRNSPPSETHASQGKNVHTNMRNSAFPRALILTYPNVAGVCHSGGSSPIICKMLELILNRRHCLRVRYRTPRLRGYGSGTGRLDTDSRGPVPDTPMRNVSGPVVCETTTDKYRDKNKKKFHSASSAIFDAQRETNLYLLSCLTLFKQLSSN